MLKAFNLFRLLENEITEIFSMGEVGGTKVCEAEEVREYFINSIIEYEVVG